MCGDEWGFVVDDSPQLPQESPTPTSFFPVKTAIFGIQFKEFHTLPTTWKHRATVSLVSPSAMMQPCQ
jgi:glucose/arabinose dehydrogenase